MKEFETIRFGVENRVATIKLNQPKTMNAVSQKMRHELLEVIQEIESNKDIRVAVLTAEGRGFSSGGDGPEGLAGFKTVEDKMIAEYLPIIEGIKASSKLYISAIHGACAGITIGIAMVCDLSMMSEDAYLYIPFAELNLVPDGGVSYHLVRNVGYKRAMEMFINAEKIPASKCLEYGLVNRITSTENLQTEAQKWAEVLAKGAPLSHKLGKQCLQYAMQHELTDVVKYEAKLQTICSYDKDTLAAIRARFNKEKPNFENC